MNSDPHENAAWRTFGLLDSDEATAFDESLRHDPVLRDACREMNQLAAAIAVNSIPPVTPRAGQLERLHLRLGLNPIGRRNWLAISGWATAACLAGLLALDHFTKPFSTITLNPPVPELAAPKPPEILITTEDDPVSREKSGSDGDASTNEGLSIIERTNEGKAFAKVETKRLIQEIEILRDKLENFQKQDRKRFEPTPGLAWPIVMRMVPPGTSGEIENGLVATTDEPPIVALLGDALTASGTSYPRAETGIARVNEFAQVKSDASAIPIYDAARDTGTLVVSNLPAKTEDERFNLWVVTKEGDNPVYVGRLPDSTNQGTDSFDFSLGSTAVVPTGFLLTKDAATGPVAPTEFNTILLGPR